MDRDLWIGASVVRIVSIDQLDLRSGPVRVRRCTAPLHIIAMFAISRFAEKNGRDMLVVLSGIRGFSNFGPVLLCDSDWSDG